MNQNQECDCSHVQRGASDGQSMGGSAVPSAAPPASSLTDQGDHVMSEQMPNQQPPQVDQSDASAGGGDSIPTLDPESAGQSASSGAVGAWVNGKRVSALWAINQNRNSWVHIAGVGWRKLANNSDSVTITLTMLGANAKQSQTSVNYREESDGMIHEMYVW